MNFITGYSLGRQIESLRIDETMVLRRINENNLLYRYSLITDNDQIIEFDSLSRARVGDRVVRNEMGGMFLVTKAAYEKIYMEVDTRLIVYSSQEKNYVTVSLRCEDGVGKNHMICMAENNSFTEGWRFVHADELTGLSFDEARLRMTAFEIMMRKVFEIDPTGKF